MHSTRLIGRQSGLATASHRSRRRTCAMGVVAAASTPPAPPLKPLVVVGSANADIVLKVGRLPAPGETIGASSLEVFPGGKVRCGGGVEGAAS